MGKKKKKGKGKVEVKNPIHRAALFDSLVNVYNKKLTN